LTFLPPIYPFLQSGELSRSVALTIVEVGAARGQDTLRLASLFPAARVIAFEPDPRNLEHLAKMAWPTNVTIIPAAIGERVGYTEFFLSDGLHPYDATERSRPWTYSSSLRPQTAHMAAQHPWVKFPGQVKVPMTTLDALVDDYRLAQIDLVWADVQGAEDLMVAGGQRALARTRFLFTEYADVPEYQGQVPLADIHRRLPGGEAAWRLREKWSGDALFERVGAGAGA
jgi:2-O-methyltransferase